VRALSNVDPALRRCWLAVARSAAVGTTPVKTWLLGEPYVVVRIDGEVVVLEDRCPHRLAPLSAGEVVDSTLECAYHGWRFDGTGRCVEIPSVGKAASIPPKARCGAPYGIAERYGLVFVALDAPLVDLPEVDAFGDPTRVRVDLDPFSGRYGAAQLIDNQLDVAHFAYLHRETFGSSEARVVPGCEIVRHRWGFETTMSIPITARNDPAAASGDHPVEQERTMRYRYLAPFFVELELTYPVMGGSNVIVFFVQPETPERSTMYVTLLLEQPGGFTAGELADRVAFEYRVVDEDLALQERFDDLALPLDVTTECHVRTDKASLELRRLLAQIVQAP